MILHGDMPFLTTRRLDSLIEEFDRSYGSAVVWASCRGKLGNPVILPTTMVTNVSQLSGDTGAKLLIESCGLRILQIEIGDPPISDVDNEEQLYAAGGKTTSRS